MEGFPFRRLFSALRPLRMRPGIARSLGLCVFGLAGGESLRPLNPSPRLCGWRYRRADFRPAPAPLQQPTVQGARGVDHPLQNPRPAAEARGELPLLLRAYREQHAVTGGADLDPLLRADAETVPAAHVAEPPARELELLRRIAQGSHEGGDIEI